jgi:hypothetical protein
LILSAEIEVGTGLITMQYMPEFDDQLLRELAQAMRKRSKALKHKVPDLKIDRVIYSDDGSEKEMMWVSCDCGWGDGKLPVAVEIYDDRWLCISLKLWRKPSWVWQWNIQGRLLHNCSARQFVEKLEETIAVSFIVEKYSTDLFDSIWKKVCARGPELID